MQTYIGTKLVRMQPMTRFEYNEFRGWTVPADENPEDEGYLVEYLDGGKPNTPHYDGYVSWSPKAQADAAYRATSGMSFGLAIEALKKGATISRAAWKATGMCLTLAGRMPHDDTSGASPHGRPGDLLPNIIHMWPSGAKDPCPDIGGWVASLTDMLADDWTIVE